MNVGQKMSHVLQRRSVEDDLPQASVIQEHAHNTARVRVNNAFMVLVANIVEMGYAANGHSVIVIA